MTIGSRAALVAMIALASVAAACGRGQRRTTGPTPAPSPTTNAPAAVVTRPDSAAPADTAARPAPTPAATPTDTADSAGRPANRARRRDAADPTSRCRVVDFTESPPTSRLQSMTDAAGKVISYLGGGVVARCSGIRNRLQADSAEYYETNGVLYLMNNVVYDEPRRVHLTSNRLTYYTREERLVAEGNVVMTMPTGTTMTGPNAEYLREAPGLRDRSRLTASGRPTLRVIADEARDTTPRPAGTPARKDTATIIANNILDEGDSLVYASGQVEIVRTDVTANADSATFDQGTELARLINRATIRGRGQRAFTLSGSLVDLFSRQRELTRVVSRGQAHVVSEDLDLKSDTVDLRVRDRQVERAFAWGPSRAVATSPDRDVTADSIEAVLPAQRIRMLYAVRGAVARSVPDTTNIVSKERDLLAGDTIVARFDTTLAPQDTTKNPPIRQIVANGNAKAYYQIATSEGKNGPPGINYVLGRLITVAFDSGQVQTVTVTDSAHGVYLEPAPDSTGDSTTAAPSRPAAGRPGSGRPPVPNAPPNRRPSETAAALGRSPDVMRGRNERGAE